MDNWPIDNPNLPANHQNIDDLPEDDDVETVGYTGKNFKLVELKQPIINHNGHYMRKKFVRIDHKGTLTEKDKRVLEEIGVKIEN